VLLKGEAMTEQLKIGDPVVITGWPYLVHGRVKGFVRDAERFGPDEHIVVAIGRDPDSRLECHPRRVERTSGA
jgi:hypothetical protein